ncbi:hypothetical protein BC628DRAFT_1278229, partial [Trametes gibbosa]
VTVEEVPDIEEGGLPRKAWVEDFPTAAGTPLSTSETSNYMFYKKIDALPSSEASWNVEVFEAVGDVAGEDGRPKKEKVELWQRNPVDCIRELMGNSAFRDLIGYAPERQYADAGGKERIFSNMWTANWWWDVQKLLPPGATVAPVILASDKTTLSRMSGDKSAWPVYLTIGNIEKSDRRKPSAHAMVLLGYLPVAKLECFSEKRRALEGYRLFHLCMHKLLEPLIAAGKDGVLMTCPDGRVRRVFPMLAAYIADHPEQCLVAACKENHCPKCPVPPDERGEPVYSCLRDPTLVVEVLKKSVDGLPGEKPSQFKDWGLHTVNPFWADLPHANIFSALTPDILHQLHKGVFKTHLVSWATAAIEGGADEIDRRFKAMLKHSGLRYFKSGISLVSQWTGTEFKNMEKSFLGVVAGAADERVTRAVHAVLDFIYLAHFETHTDSSLEALHQSWLDYHKYKAVFVELDICEHFNFPKGHSMEHYEPSIRSVGTADGYSTEHLERLHIDFAKLAYGASNKQASYIQQMTRWLECQEAVHRFASYLDWARMQPSLTMGSLPDSCHSHAHDGCSELSPSSTQPPSSIIPPGSSSISDSSTASLSEPTKNGYRVAKVPAYGSLSVIEIETSFGATSFKTALADHLKNLADGNPRHLALVSTPLHDLSRIAAYKQAKVRLPVIRQVSKYAPIDIIHASPSHAGPRHLQSTIPAQMLTVFAR